MGHAPHNGHDCHTRKQWWDDVADIFQRHVDTDPMVLMLGANAEPGKRTAKLS